MMLSRMIRRPRLQRWWRRRLLGITTYYNSQSGMHVPLHDENAVSVYIDQDFCLSDFEEIDPSSYEFRETLESLQAMHAAGTSGARLPMGAQRVALSLSESLVSTAPGFTLFAPPLPMRAVSYPNNVNLLFEYTDSRASVTKSLSKHVAKGTRTSIGLFDPCYYHRLPIGVANGVAKLIDSTGGCNFVWLCDDRALGEDEMVELCEELSYLDVVGPT